MVTDIFSPDPAQQGVAYLRLSSEVIAKVQFKVGTPDSWLNFLATTFSFQIAKEK